MSDFIHFVSSKQEVNCRKFIDRYRHRKNIHNKIKLIEKISDFTHFVSSKQEVISRHFIDQSTHTKR